MVDFLSLAEKRIEVGDLKISASDRELLRRLASHVADLAARPVENRKRSLWYRLNALKTARPLVFCSPENGWTEIITPDQIECTGSLARSWECALRMQIFWGESMKDDKVIEPEFALSYICSESDWGMHETKTQGRDGGSYVWDAPLKSYDDLAKLHFPSIEVDRKATQELVDVADETLGDLLPVQLKGFWPILGITWTAVTLRGLEQFMTDMCLYPDETKRLMAFIRDENLARCDYLERKGLLALNNRGDYVGSGGFGYTRELPQADFDGSYVRTRDLWGFGESQESASVSPEQFEEFIFQYQVPVLDRFGLNCYGCCEPLDLRWHVVKKTPRLRRVSVSPWANLEKMAECLTDQYVFSLKPNPAPLASATLDEALVRGQLRKALEITRGCRVEIIMKDTHTIGRNPQNVIRWCQIAREEANDL